MQTKSSLKEGSFDISITKKNPYYIPGRFGPDGSSDVSGLGGRAGGSDGVGVG
jgi:hypothetical protein